MISSQLNTSLSELTLICGLQLLFETSSKSESEEEPVADYPLLMTPWHYFIMCITYWRVYQVNYKEASFAWKYIVKLEVSNKRENSRKGFWPQSFLLLRYIADVYISFII